MPPFVQQRRVAVGGGVFVLDAANDEVKLAVEMDGAAWHGSRTQREDDIRRDALLATVGWQTLRFGFSRMTTAPDTCRPGDLGGLSRPAAADGARRWALTPPSRHGKGASAPTLRRRWVGRGLRGRSWGRRRGAPRGSRCGRRR